MTKYIYALSLILLFSFTQNLPAQKFMQIETYGKPQVQKIFIGNTIQYKLDNNDQWDTGVIRDFLVEKNIIELDDRFIDISKIHALRFNRKYTKTIQSSLYLFGIAWSGFALIGYTTDGNPDTQYSKFDLGVSLASGIAGWGIGKLFKYKTIKIGKRKKLRLLDVHF